MGRPSRNAPEDRERAFRLAEDASSGAIRRGARPDGPDDDPGRGGTVGSVDDSHDDALATALAEALIGLFKTEGLRRRGRWRTLEGVENRYAGMGAPFSSNG